MTPQPEHERAKTHEQRRQFFRETRGRMVATITVCDIREQHTQAIELELHRSPNEEPSVVFSRVTPDGEVSPFCEVDADELFDGLQRLRAFIESEPPATALELELAKSEHVTKTIRELVPDLLAMLGVRRRPERAPAPVVALRDAAPTSPEPLDSEDESEAP